MKKAFLSIIAALSFLAPALAEEYKSSDGLFVVDLSSGWKPAGTKDPDIVLRLERGGSFVDFAKLYDELNERYLRMRVREQVESLRSKGVALGGDIRIVSLHGVCRAFYTGYVSGETDVHLAFFTYNGASFAVSARGLPESEFRNMLSTIRKPGEKIDLPKPRKVRVVKKKAPGGAGMSPQGAVSSTGTDTR